MSILFRSFPACRALWRGGLVVVVAASCGAFLSPGLAQTRSSGVAPNAKAGVAADAAVQADGAWVRATVPGQRATGAFMRLTARDGLRLVGVSSPVAGVAEVHEMKMDQNVMKMRAIDSLDLPAGQPVQLQPGGYHLMLMDLRQPLPKDTSVPLTLEFKDAKGAVSRLQLSVPVSANPPASASGPAGGVTAPGHGAHRP